MPAEPGTVVSNLSPHLSSCELPSCRLPASCFSLFISSFELLPPNLSNMLLPWIIWLFKDVM